MARTIILEEINIRKLTSKTSFQFSIDWHGQNQIPYYPFRGGTQTGGGSNLGRFTYAQGQFVMAQDYFNTNTQQTGNVNISQNTTNDDAFYPQYTSINFIIKT